MSTRKKAEGPAAKKTTPKKGASPARKRGKRHAAAHLKKTFLEGYRRSGNIRAAAEAAGIARRTHYNWIESDPEYAGAFEEAREDAADVLEAAAWKRAVVGVEEPTGWYQGMPGGTVRKYSDTLLIFLLKGMRPEKYRDRHELAGPNNEPLHVVLKREY